MEPSPSPRIHRTTGATPPLDQAARLAALNARAVRPPTFPPNPSAPPLPPPPPAPPDTRRRPRRRHAARGARAAALGLSLASTGALATLFAYTGGGSSETGNQVAAASVVTSTADPSTATETAPAPTVTTLPVTTTPTVVTTAPTVASAPATTASTVTSGATTAVDGAVFQNKWGDVQVEVTFASDGTIVDVTTLQTPYVDDKSVRINQRAVPQLNSEALTAQNAEVDTVSGATYTSNDYRRSLQSAIDEANAAGITTIV